VLDPKLGSDISNESRAGFWDVGWKLGWVPGSGLGFSILNGIQRPGCRLGPGLRSSMGWNPRWVQVFAMEPRLGARMQVWTRAGFPIFGVGPRPGSSLWGGT
jgi:hypothetical protein